MTIALCLIVWGCFFLILGFFDFEFTSYLYNPSNSLVCIIQLAPYISTLIVVTLSLSILFKYYPKSWLTLSLYISSLLVFFLFFTQRTYDDFRFPIFSIPLWIFISLTLSAFVIKRDNTTPLLPHAKTYLFTLLTVFILVTSIKYVWNRERFKNLESPDHFEYVWVYQGYDHNHEDNSFPSGHTALAALSLYLPYVLYKLNVKKTVLSIASVLMLLFTVGTAAGRIIGGFHYLTDTYFSISLVLLIYYVYQKTFHQPLKKAPQ